MSIKSASVTNKMSTSYSSAKPSILRAFTLSLVFFLATRQIMANETTWQKSVDKADYMLSTQNLLPAEMDYRQAVKELTALGQHTTEQEVGCLNSLANVLALENKTDEAAATYRRILSVLEKSYGDTSTRLLPTLFKLGSIFESVGDHDSAMRYYNRAIALNETNYGRFSPNFINQIPHGQIVSASDSGAANYTNKQGVGSKLKLQPGLQSSKSLKNLLPSYKVDLLNNDYNSDQELTSIFHNEIAESTGKTKDIASGSNPSSPGNIKQPEIVKQSRRI